MEFRIKKLSKEFSFQLDEEDALKFVGISITKSSHGYLKINSGGYKGEKYVHRVVLNANKNEIVDHINGDKLDNRKSNLRICTQAKNCLNKRNRSNNVSGIAGVYYSPSREKWCAQISVNNKTIPLGRFDKKEDAVSARVKAQEKYHGEYSSLQGVLKREGNSYD